MTRGHTRRLMKYESMDILAFLLVENYLKKCSILRNFWYIFGSLNFL